MGEEQSFGKACLAASNHRIGGKTGKAVDLVHKVRTESQRHKGRTRRHDVEAELFGEIIAEAGGPHLGYRLAACRDDERGAGDAGVIRCDREA